MAHPPKPPTPRTIKRVAAPGSLAPLVPVFIAMGAFCSLFYFFFLSETWENFSIGRVLHEFVWGTPGPPSLCYTYERMGWNARPCQQYIIHPDQTRTIKIDLIFRSLYLAQPPNNVKLRGCDTEFYQYLHAPPRAMNLTACGKSTLDVQVEGTETVTFTVVYALPSAAPSAIPTAPVTPHSVSEHCTRFPYDPQRTAMQRAIFCSGVTTEGEYVPVPRGIPHVWFRLDRGEVWVYDCSKEYRNLRTEHNRINGACGQIHIRVMSGTADVSMHVWGTDPDAERTVIPKVSTPE